MPRGETRIVRLDPVLLAIFFPFSLFLAILGLLFTFLQSELNLEGLVLVAAAVFLLIVIFGHTMELAPGKLVRRVLFVPTTVELAKVREVCVIRRPLDAPHAAPMLELYPTFDPAPDAKPMFSFIIKPFSQKGVTAILRHIRENAPEANFDRISSDLLEGKFEAVTREILTPHR